MDGTEGGQPVLDALLRRAHLMRELRDEPLEKRELADRLDDSRSTIDRAVRELEALDLVERRGSGVATTVTGRLAIDWLSTVETGLGEIADAGGVLEPLPATAPLEAAAVVGADPTVAADPTPYRPVERFHDAVGSADRYRAVLPTLDDPRHVRLLYERVVTEGRPAELVVSEELFRTLREEFPRRFAAMADHEGFRLLVGEDIPPFALALLGDGDPTLALVTFTGAGSVHGLLTNDRPAAVRWGESLLEGLTAAATERTDDLVRRDPDRRGRSSGESLPVPLEREGFVELDVRYFRDEPAADPATAWRAGLSLTEVHTGYAVARRRSPEGATAPDSGAYRGAGNHGGADRGGTATPLSGSLVADLADGVDCVVVGPAGSGKSTVCKRVACEWYETDRGPVLYREGGRGRRFASVDDLVTTVEAADGHALVVVEDAVRPDAAAVFDAADRLSDRDDVSFLLDAREAEWASPPEEVGLPPDPAVVTVPPLDEATVERIVERFERTAGQSVDVPTDRLYEDVRTETDEAGDGPRPSELLALTHRLATYADPTGGGQTPLEATVANCYDDLPDEGPGLRAAVLANAMNVAGLDVAPEALYAVVGDEGTFSAVDAALERLEGEVLFPRPDGSYRTVHESWSALFLDRLLRVGGGEDDEGDRTDRDRDVDPTGAAAGTFGRAVTEYLGLAADPARRDRIAAHTGDGAALAAIEDDPAGWVDGTVEALYGVARERPKLAPLFWTGDGDGGGTEAGEDDALAPTGEVVELPSVAPDGVDDRRRVRIARALVDGGHYDRAERALRRLGNADGRGDGTGGGPTERDGVGRGRGVDLDVDPTAERLLGLSRIDRERGNLDRAEARVRRYLGTVEGGGDDRPVTVARARLLLGQVASDQGEFDAADARYEAALEGFESVGDRRRVARVLGAVGTSSLWRGAYDRARDHHERALRIRRALADRQGVARSLNSLGIAARREGDFEAARDYFQRSLATARAVGDRKLRADALNNLGILAAIRADFERASERFERSLSLTRALGDRQGESGTLNNLALVAERLGDYDRARKHYERDLELKAEMGQKSGRIGPLNNLGTTFERQGEYDRARECRERAIETARETGATNEEAAALGNLGTLARLRGEYETAREYHEESLALNDEVGEDQMAANGNRQLGLVALERGNLDRAEEHLERAEAAIDDGDEFRSAEDGLAWARLALARGDHRTAGERASDARESFADMGASHFEARARALVGRAAAGAGDRGTAREHLSAAVGTFERVGAPQDVLVAAAHLVEVCRTAGDDDAADRWRRRVREAAEAAPEGALRRHRELIVDHLDTVPPD
jgi:tetratricopeptide (TPR) repeat protein/predicted transcriptional regulator